MPCFCAAGRREIGNESMDFSESVVEREAEFGGSKAYRKYAPNLILVPVHTDLRLRDFDWKQQCVSVHITHIIARHPTAPSPPSVDSQGSRVGGGAGDAHLRSAIGKSDRCLVLDGVGLVDLKVLQQPDDPDALDSWNYDGKQLHITWKQDFEPAQQRRIDVTYRVQRPVSGLFFSTACGDGDSAKGPLYAITDHETERARYWLTCIDYPSIRTTLGFEIVAPEHMVALANGKLVKETVDAVSKTKTWQWRLDHQCPSYLICWAVGEFERVDDGEVDGIPISYFGPKNLFKPDDIRRAFDRTPSMIKWLQEKLGSPFPWPKYYQIAAAEVGGAMENISLVTWNDRFLMDAIWAKERKLITDLVNIHEMAHTYFGDLIVIRHFDQVWLKESWATYMESVWLQDHIGEDDFRYEMYLNSQQYIKEADSSYMRPMVQRSYNSSWSLFDNHTYPGGAWRIHMLRKLLGDDCFWTAVKQYVAAYRGTVVETEDFRKMLESQSGLNLMPFFDEWFYGRGYPKFKIAYEWDLESRMVKLSAEQTQTTGLFKLGLDVEVIGTDGTSVRDVLIFDGLEKKTVLRFHLGGSGDKPAVINVDPECKILCTVDFAPGETILYETAKRSKDVLNRIRACQGLIKIGTYSAMAKISELMEQESFHGVRVQIAEALGNSRTVFALEQLIKLVRIEKNPMALYLIIRELKIVDGKVRSVLRELLQRPDLPYRAREYALENLGYQANEEDLPYLLQVAKDPNQLGQHNFIRAGALKALCHFSQPEVYEYLYERVATRTSEPVRLARPSAVEALARCTSIHPEKSYRIRTEKLLKQLVTTDPDFSTRKSAISWLVQMGTKSAVDTLESSRPLFAAQDEEWLDGKIQTLSKSGSTGSSAELQKKIDTLEERLRALEDKLLERKVSEEKTDKS